MLDGFRDRIRRPAGGPGDRGRHVTRREQELRQRRMLYLFAGLMGAIAIVALVGGALYQYVIYPRQDLAKVGGVAIERRDYWKVRDIQLRQNIAQLSQQFNFVGADQQAQIQQQVQLAQEELDNLEDAPIASDTLATMVDDQVILQHLDDFDITITDDEVDQYVREQFAPVPLSSPTPTSTVEPTAAAWATGTSEAQDAEATAAASETAAIATQTAQAGSPVASPSGTPEEDDAAAEPTGTAAADATGTPDASPTASGSATPEASPSGSPAVTETPTPNAEQAIATSETTFELFDENYLQPADMSRGDYERLIVRPTIARQRISEQLVSEVPARAEQVHAAHILVATEEAANEVLERLNAGEDFAAIAQEVSTDTSTAGNGGDLGWFPRGIMVAPFEEAAFALEPGAVSEPVQSEFGWHVIKVFEKEADRPLTVSTKQTLEGNVFGKWLDQARAETDISADIALPGIDDATTTGDVFEAPPDAPLPPTPTPAPTPTAPLGTPEATDEASPTP